MWPGFSLFLSSPLSLREILNSVSPSQMTRDDCWVLCAMKSTWDKLVSIPHLWLIPPYGFESMRETHWPWFVCAVLHGSTSLEYLPFHSRLGGTRLSHPPIPSILVFCVETPEGVTHLTPWLFIVEGEFFHSFVLSSIQPDFFRYLLVPRGREHPENNSQPCRC